MHRIKAKMKAIFKAQNTGYVYFYAGIDNPFL